MYSACSAPYCSEFATAHAFNSHLKTVNNNKKIRIKVIKHKVLGQHSFISMLDSLEQNLTTATAAIDIKMQYYVIERQGIAAGRGQGR